MLEIPSRKEFVCPDCGQELFECAPPKKKNNVMLYGIIAGVVVIVLFIVAFCIRGEEQNVVSEKTSFVEEPTESPDLLMPQGEEPMVDKNATLPMDSIVDEDAPAITPSTTSSQKKSNSSRSKDLGYARWSGALKNGQPNDENGTMTFKESHLIDSRDPQKREALPGDYIIGEYVDGKLVQGIWYDKSNTVKGSIIIGR